MNAPILNDLATDVLESADGLEVVTTYVEFPAGMQGPTHTHPGEEFAYILEGSVYLWEEGKGETRYVAGDSCMVSMGALHKVRTADESVKLVAFRVHIIGEPERTLIDVDH
jgi:quercetin dioxygenase-like cupin family protein